MAFEDRDIDAIYILTDGKPDSSTTLVPERSSRHE